MIRATYRLQFHKGFTCSDAATWVEYFAALFVRHDGDPLVMDALRRFPQLSAPVAKAAEDTAFYRYGASCRATMWGSIRGGR